MFSDSTKSPQHGVRPSPDAKLCIDEDGEFIDRREEPIVNPKPAQQFPNAFDRIELRAVGGKKQKREIRFLRLTPRRMEYGVVISGIVDNDDNASPRPSTDVTQMAEEPPTGLRIEVSGRWQSAQFAISQSYCPEVADAFSGGSVNAHRVLNLRRYPHAAAAPVLVEMHFIQRPQIHAGIGGENVESFLLRP